MKFVSSAIVFLISCSSLLANATTATLDFESLKQNDASFTFLTGEYAEAGYTLTVSDPEPYSFASAGDLNSRYAGSTALTTFNFGTVSLVNTSGSNFDFLSLDVAPVFLGADDPFGMNRDLNAVYETTIYGLKGDGSFVSQVITIPNSSLANILTTIQLIGFTDLSQVALINASFPGVQFDNLVLNTASVSAVPAPAAVWLFASGLLGIIGLRKRV